MHKTAKLVLFKGKKQHTLQTKVLEHPVIMSNVLQARNAGKDCQIKKVYQKNYETSWVQTVSN